MNLFSDEEVKEFIVESTELLDQAESDLLKSESGNYVKIYDSVFRVFHSLKGGAGMLGFPELQKHMHQIESILSGTKGKTSLSKAESDFFLSGVDAARKILAGETVNFVYTVASADASKATAAPQTSQGPTSAPSNAKSATQPTQATSQASSRSARLTSAAKKTGLAYVVDDEPEILSLISDILVDAGFETHTFENPEELLQSIEKVEPDIILSDVKMPQMTGIELLKSVRGAGFEMPVILVSGYLSKESLLDAISSGIYAAIEKPFNEGTLLNYAMAAAKHARTARALKKSLNLLLYQFADLEDFLLANGKEDIANAARAQLNELLEQNRELNAPKT